MLICALRFTCVNRAHVGLENENAKTLQIVWERWKCSADFPSLKSASRMMSWWVNDWVVQFYEKKVTSRHANDIETMKEIGNLLEMFLYVDQQLSLAQERTMRRGKNKLKRRKAKQKNRSGSDRIHKQHQLSVKLTSIIFDYQGHSRFSLL